MVLDGVGGLRVDDALGAEHQPGTFGHRITGLVRAFDFGKVCFDLEQEFIGVTQRRVDKHAATLDMAEHIHKIKPIAIEKSRRRDDQRCG